MGKIAVVTDSNSGITQEKGKDCAYSDVKWAKQHLRDGDYAVKGL